MTSDDFTLYTVYQCGVLVITSFMLSIWGLTFAESITTSARVTITVASAGYFVTGMVAQTTLILFLGALETGPHPGQYRETMDLGYNNYIKLASNLWILAASGLILGLFTHYMQTNVLLAYLTSFVMSTGIFFVFFAVHSYNSQKPESASKT
jgi:hypothetical protein